MEAENAETYQLRSEDHDASWIQLVHPRRTSPNQEKDVCPANVLSSSVTDEMDLGPTL